MSLASLVGLCFFYYSLHWDILERTKQRLYLSNKREGKGALLDDLDVIWQGPEGLIEMVLFNALCLSCL